MKPLDNSDTTLLVYADWLDDAGGGGEEIRAAVNDPKRRSWTYEYTFANVFSVGGGGGGVGGGPKAGVVGGVGSRGGVGGSVTDNHGVGGSVVNIGSGSVGGGNGFVGGG